MIEALRVHNIGTLKGPVLVFGGVYSNLQALQKMMEIAHSLQISAQNIICTGDIVAYCAQPEACVQAVKDWGVHVIAGNVEIQLRDGETDCGCNFDEGSRCDLFSRKWYPYAQAHLSPNAIEWMRQLPHHLRFQYAQKEGYVLHGSYFDTSEFIFRSTPWSTKMANFDATQAHIILSGHCGLPFTHQNQAHVWANAGVIGMPANDGTPRVWYMLMDETNNEPVFRHIPFEYDHHTAAQEMEQKHLPREYSATLRSGVWDNCDILPETETAAQGRFLEL